MSSENKIEKMRSVRRKLNGLPPPPPRDYITITHHSPTRALVDKHEEIDKNIQELYRRVEELEEIVFSLLEATT